MATPAAGLNNNSQLYQTANISNITQSPWNPIPSQYANQANLPPMPKLNKISISNGKICGLNSASNIWCNQSNSPNNFSQIPNSPKLTNISIYGNQAVGTDNKNKIWYTGNINSTSTNWTPLIGSLKQVSISGNRICGVNNSNNIYCNSPPSAPVFAQVPGAQAGNLAVFGNTIAAIAPGGSSILYTNNTNSNPAWLNLCSGSSCPGKLPLRQISVTANGFAVLDNNSNIYYYNNSNKTWSPVAGSFSYISLDNYPAGAACKAHSDCNGGAVGSLGCCSNTCMPLTATGVCPQYMGPNTMAATSKGNLTSGQSCATQYPGSFELNAICYACPSNSFKVPTPVSASNACVGNCSNYPGTVQYGSGCYLYPSS